MKFEEVAADVRPARRQRHGAGGTILTRQAIVGPLAVHLHDAGETVEMPLDPVAAATILEPIGDHGR